MNNFPNKKDRKLVLGVWLVCFPLAVSFGLFLLADQSIGTILTFVLFAGITIYFSTLIKKVSQGYFLKYYYNKKEFEKQYNEALKKFNGADEEFIKDFKERAKFTYCTSGNIFVKLTIEHDKWLLSNKDNLIGLNLLINLLDNAIVNKTGFNAFIDNAYKLTNSGELIMQTLENNFLSGELRCLLFKVYLLTDFNLDDNGLSEEYTNNINKLRKELEERYDKILYNFEDEIIAIKNKIGTVNIDNKTDKVQN